MILVIKYHMHRKHLSIGLCVLLASMLGCTSVRQKEVGKGENESLVIFAAAGARTISNEVCDLFEEKVNYHVERSFASSGLLARQIANGADADVFISANYDWIQYLLEENFLDSVSVKRIASNSLVFVAPISSELIAPEFTPDFDINSIVPGVIAMGDPSFVPVGKYAKMVLDSLGWFDVLKDKIILAKDVSSVLHYAELGACDWAIVYYTEAIQSSKVKILADVPESLHSPIYFYLAGLNSTSPEVTELCDFITNNKMKSIYEKFGFKYME